MLQTPSSSFRSEAWHPSHQIFHLLLRGHSSFLSEGEYAGLAHWRRMPMHAQPVLRTFHVRHGFCLRRQLRLPAPPSSSLFLGRSARQALECTVHKLCLHQASASPVALPVVPLSEVHRLNASRLFFCAMLLFLPPTRSLGLATTYTYRGIGLGLFRICATYGVLSKVMVLKMWHKSCI